MRIAPLAVPILMIAFSLAVSAEELLTFYRQDLGIRDKIQYVGRYDEKAGVFVTCDGQTIRLSDYPGATVSHSTQRCPDPKRGIKK
jgi:hypothetical protein